MVHRSTDSYDTCDQSFLAGIQTAFGRAVRRVYPRPPVTSPQARATRSTALFPQFTTHDFTKIESGITSQGLQYTLWTQRDQRGSVKVIFPSSV
jgi:hypothetical protein